MKKAAMKKQAPDGEGLRKVDWLAVAIGNIGSPKKAAGKLATTEGTVYEWLERGLATVPFYCVVQLSKFGDVPLEYLARRLGPDEAAMAFMRRAG